MNEAVLADQRVEPACKPGSKFGVADAVRVTISNRETSRRPHPAVFVNAEAGRLGHLEAKHLAAETIPDLGLSFERSASVIGYGNVLDGAGCLVEGKGIARRIALDFARNEGLIANGPHGAVRNVDVPLLSVAGAGHAIWGHWLLDFLPRIILAQKRFGAGLSDMRVPLPSDIPRWVVGMLSFFAGVGPDKLILFDGGTGSIKTSEFVCIPDDMHHDYFLHSEMKLFYDRFICAPARALPERICVSRKGLKERRSVARDFLQQDAFEGAAKEFGFSIVHPEDHDFRTQIDLFSNARIVVGEFGSGMHNTLFSPPGTLVGQFVMPSNIQSQIAGLRGHHLFYLLPDNNPRFDTAEVASMQVSDAAIREFFCRITR